LGEDKKALKSAAKEAKKEAKAAAKRAKAGATGDRADRAPETSARSVSPLRRVIGQSMLQVAIRIIAGLAVAYILIRLGMR
jgi:hypothetical protein